MSNHYFPSLPAELQICILGLLHCRDLLNTCATCKSLHYLQTSSIELQYLLELAADNTRDISAQALDTATKLSMLRERREKWRTLAFSGTRAMHIPGSCMSYKLAGGMFAKTTNRRDLVGVWLNGSEHAEVDPPGPEGEQLDVHWPELGCTMKDFAMDPTQDLLTLIDYFHPDRGSIWVHFRTLSTNKAHPDAAVPSMSLTALALPNAIIQIVDDVFGLWGTADNFRHLTIASWKTGDVLVDEFWHDDAGRICDFAFLSARAFMLARLGGVGSLELCTFASTPGRMREHRATLYFPSVRSEARCCHINMYAGPFLGGKLKGKPFMCSRDAMVYTISLQYDIPDADDAYISDRSFFLAFVHRLTLLSFINAHAGGAARTALWDDWGPSKTRFLEQYNSFVWRRYVHGGRVLLPPISLRGAETSDGFVVEHCMELLDFGVHPSLERQTSTLTAGETVQCCGDIGGDCCLSELVIEPTTLTNTSVFLDPIVSSLPYRRVRRRLRQAYSGFMLDEDGVVGVSATRFSMSMKELHMLSV